MENYQTKQCTTCKIVKNLSCYSRLKRSKDGLSNVCKKCCSDYLLYFFRTKIGLSTKMYSSQKRNSKRRNHNPPSYTIIEFRAWLFSNVLFHKLYDEWVASGYEKDLVPSVDRKDDYIGYTIDNIQITSWINNNLRCKKDRKEGINNKTNKSIDQYSKDGVFLRNYHSINDASRISCVDLSNISCVCRGKRTTAGGFIWKFSNS